LWLPITYRDFYDVPRAVVVEYHGRLFFFDCPFCHDLDDFPEQFDVYELPHEVEDVLATVNWNDLAATGKFVGRIPVKSVEFDASKRQSVKSAVLDRLFRGRFRDEG
jgi:hypothetical protein